MAATVTFDCAQMSAAENQIRNTHAEAYKAAAASFRTAMDTAIERWSGDSKNEFQLRLNEKIYPYLETNVPEMVVALADVLHDNAASMSDVDAQIAAQIASAFAT